MAAPTTPRPVRLHLAADHYDVQFYAPGVMPALLADWDDGAHVALALDSGASSGSMEELAAALEQLAVQVREAARVRADEEASR